MGKERNHCGTGERCRNRNRVDLNRRSARTGEHHPHRATKRVRAGGVCDNTVNEGRGCCSWNTEWATNTGAPCEVRCGTTSLTRVLRPCVLTELRDLTSRERRYSARCLGEVRRAVKHKRRHELHNRGNNGNCNDLGPKCLTECVRRNCEVCRANIGRRNDSATGDAAVCRPKNAYTAILNRAGKAKLWPTVNRNIDERTAILIPLAGHRERLCVRRACHSQAQD